MASPDAPKSRTRRILFWIFSVDGRIRRGEFFAGLVISFALYMLLWIAAAAILYLYYNFFGVIEDPAQFGKDIYHFIDATADYVFKLILFWNFVALGVKRGNDAGFSILASLFLCFLAAGIGQGVPGTGGFVFASLFFLIADTKAKKDETKKDSA